MLPPQMNTKADYDAPYAKRVIQSGGMMAYKRVFTGYVPSDEPARVTLSSSSFTDPLYRSRFRCKSDEGCTDTKRVRITVLIEPVKQKGKP